MMGSGRRSAVRAASGGIVAADVLRLGVHLGLLRDWRRDGTAARKPGACSSRGTTGSQDRFGARERLMLVGERTVAAAVLVALELRRRAVVGRHLRVEEQRHDLFADRPR